MSSDTETKLPPLAIVGMSLRFPQDAESPESFWDMIMQGRCATTEFPEDRLNIDAHYHPDGNRQDSLSMRGGHFMAGDISAFDAPFFSITAAEAEAMDPQQRLILETAFRGLENAGLTMDDIAGSKTGVFTGSFGHDYLTLQVKDPQALPKWYATGVSMNMLSNRVSWFFDLVGPSVTVDTACSSSLAALDLTCQSIWAGDSSMGLAIGSNAILALETGLSLDNLGLLSPDSRCHSFDISGNGYARGEGVGVLVIRPLDDAIRNGDTIRAVIRSSASNQDGKTPGITQPSIGMQAKLIRDTYRKNGLDMGLTRYVEAHGTGTEVGDPIEVKSIGSIFRDYRSKEDPLYLGSVKSNVGHLEGASGVAGVIKAVLALEHGVIPPNSVNYKNMNPKIDEEYLRIKIPREAVLWPEGPRRASVSSFGFGGSNIHIVLDDARSYMEAHNLEGNHMGTKPGSENAQIRENTQRCVTCCPSAAFKLLVWSTADEDGIARVKETWKPFLSSVNPQGLNKEEFLGDLAYTLATRRTHLGWRTFALASPSDDWSSVTDTLAAPSRASASPSLAFVFTGQGAQWFGMGRELLGRYPVFLRSIKEAGSYLCTLGCEWNVLDELERSELESNVNRTEYSQALCTVLQVALVDTLASLNIHPTSVVGHSSGEIAAAYCAQAISRQSAWKIAYLRGKLSQKLEDHGHMQGAMLAVGLSYQEVVQIIKDVRVQFDIPRLTVACVNSPGSVTISGEATQVDALKAALDKRGVFSRKLKVRLGYHSFQMQEIAALYEEMIEGVEKGPRQGKCPLMVSSVTGTWIEAEAIRQPKYWVENMVSPVQFADALSLICSGTSKDPVKKIDGSHRKSIRINQLIEIGPHAALQGPCRQIMQQDVSYGSVLVRNQSAVESLLSVIGSLYAAGHPVDIARANGDRANPKVLTDLPAYPFNKSKTYWHESYVSKNHRLRKHGRVDLLGTPEPTSNSLKLRWRNIIKVAEMPWVKDHMLNETILYPGAGMVVMAIEAAKQVADPSKQVVGFQVTDASFHAAIRVPLGVEGVETALYMSPDKDLSPKSPAWFNFQVCMYFNDDWIENCTGSVKVVYGQDKDSADDDDIDESTRCDLLRERLQVVRRAQVLSSSSVSGEYYYNLLNRSGYKYGDAFKLIETLDFDRENTAQVLSRVTNFSSNAGEVIHPTTLDAVFQTSLWTMTKSGSQRIPTAVPTYVERLWVSSTGVGDLGSEVLNVHTTAKKTYLFGDTTSMTAFDQSLKTVLISAEGLRCSVINSSEALTDSPTKQSRLCHYIDWKLDPTVLSKKEVMELCHEELEVPEAFFKEQDFLLYVRLKETLSIVADLKLAKPHYKKYVDWLNHRHQSLKEGRTIFTQDPWRSRFEDRTYIQQLEDRLMTTNKRGEFLATVGKNLPKFLSGELDPLSFLFEDDVVKGVYFETINDSHCLKRFSKYLDLMAHQNPHMKIVEIGAGTGSMTDILLSTLGRDGSDSTVRRYGQWDYTDISRSFFGEAQDLFAQEGTRMRFNALDIEKDPESQGFECGTYDMVIASMVLHATSDLTRTLANVRKLLKPGGKLVLYEMVQLDVIRTPFAFGLLEGWWLSSESYRQHGPCVDESRWNDLLRSSQFSGVDFMLPDYDSTDCHEQGLIISTAVEDSSPPQPRVEIVYDHADEEQSALARSVRDSTCYDVVRCVSLDEASDRVTEEPQENLLRLFLLELQKPVLHAMSQKTLKQLQSLLSSAAHVLWTNGGGGLTPVEPKFRLVDGLFRVLMQEDQRHNRFTLSLEPGTDTDRRCSHIMKMMQIIKFAPPNPDTEYLEHNGALHIGRLVDASELNNEVKMQTGRREIREQTFDCGIPLQLDAASPGLLNGFTFIENEIISEPLGPHDVEVEVRCVGINFRDVLIAVGQLNPSDKGTEFAGIITRVGTACTSFKPGDHVAAMHTMAYASIIRLTDSSPVIKIPDNLPFSIAAAVPANFTTAYICLHDIAQLKRGETVLVHSGAGGTGQAAIQIAQILGAKVFTTVGNLRKKQFLMDKYHVPANQIFSSRTSAFATAIKQQTRNGVDVVLNSLSGEGLLESWACVAPGGRFVEIGKRDMMSNRKMPMGPFMNHISYSGFDLCFMTDIKPRECAAALKPIFAWLEEGKLHAAEPIHLYGVGEIEKAFRTLQGGKHIGKLVLELRKDDLVSTALRPKPRSTFDANATFVIAGGLGGLGRNTACWLADRGARHLLLLSRSGENSPNARDLIARLQGKGVKVMAVACDISNERSLQEAIKKCQSWMPPIKGCIQAAMVLKDASFYSMSHQAWQEAIAPKVQGSWNLHRLLPRGLYFFVMLSSMSGIFGMRGQSNYAAGNTFQDSLARHRVSLGERGTALDLDVVGFTGAVVEDARLSERVLQKTAFETITESEFHTLLDYHCNLSAPCGSALSSQVAVGLQLTGNEGVVIPEWLQKPVFSHLFLEGGTTDSGPETQSTNIVALLHHATTVMETHAVITQALTEKLSKALSIPVAELDEEKPMHQYGVDSLVAVELRSWFSKELQADIPVFDILGSATIGSVAKLAANRTKIAKEA